MKHSVVRGWAMMINPSLPNNINSMIQNCSDGNDGKPQKHLQSVIVGGNGGAT